MLLIGGKVPCLTITMQKKGWQLKMKNLPVRRGRHLPSWRRDINKVFKIGKFAGIFFTFTNKKLVKVKIVGVTLAYSQGNVSRVFGGGLQPAWHKV